MKLTDKSAELRKQFTSVLKGGNFITPTLVGYVKIKDGIAEVSTGRGMDDKIVFGITVVQNGKHNEELGGSFDSTEEVETYITENLL